MRYETNMTVKGQITVPKDVRDALGLRAGQKVQIEVGDDGIVRILKAGAEQQARRDRVRELQAEFKAQDPMPGMNGLEYQRWIRESPEV